ncbi:MAG: NUDIX hydrolase [Candidatus Saccharibacteria bacterium GW2011_GWC2_48_9]|nr:MAG: NUDIX hydrolase [Candidatus Saccharibacteria bacterium GW2011_GWC2_48_9]
MFEQEINHHIQKHIISVLLYQKIARFSELRPPRTDTNLFSYHLKLLQKNTFVEKIERGYTLSPRGLSYVDRVNADKLFVRRQPKIITMLLVQDGYGNILLQRRTKQPYIDTWTLPYGKVHIDDNSVFDGAVREVVEKLGLEIVAPRHVGDAYIRVRADGMILSSTLAHVCRFELEDYSETEYVRWCAPLKLGRYELAPAVESIVTRSFFGDTFFFEEYTVDL